MDDTALAAAAILWLLALAGIAVVVRGYRRLQS
jgi:hypothetical protein